MVLAVRSSITMVGPNHRNLTGVKQGGLNANSCLIPGVVKEVLGCGADEAFQGYVQLAVELANHLDR